MTLSPEIMAQKATMVVQLMLEGADEKQAEDLIKQIQRILHGHTIDTCFLTLVSLVSAIIEKLPTEDTRSVMLLGFSTAVTSLTEFRS